MPLEFESISHGTIAFGFFNIETDMLLLNNTFFFATDFCRSISKVAEGGSGGVYESLWRSYLIENPHNMGNLGGAIRGVDHRGFIGEVYRLFPFPENPQEFKQKTDGWRNRPVIEETIKKYGRETTLLFNILPDRKEVRIGEHAFNIRSFHELLRYVWLGGYPRWNNGVRPDYVLAMRSAIDQSRNSVFQNLHFEKGEGSG
jgi:hypothetical protein